jgi:hypothetical protein
MKRFAVKALAISVATAGIVAFTAELATSDDGHYQGFIGHDRFHDDLAHRAFHRELAHREAHRYPMTWYQHERLHNALDHEAFHDHLAHRDYHRYHRPHYALRGYGLPGHSAYGSYYQSYGASYGYTLPRRRVVYYYSP